MHRVVSNVFALDENDLSARALILHHSVNGLVLSFPVLHLEGASSLPPLILQLNLVVLVEVGATLVLRKIQVLTLYISHIAWLRSN